MILQIWIIALFLTLRRPLKLRVNLIFSPMFRFLLSLSAPYLPISLNDYFPQTNAQLLLSFWYWLSFFITCWTIKDLFQTSDADSKFDNIDLNGYIFRAISASKRNAELALMFVSSLSRLYSFLLSLFYLSLLGSDREIHK